MTRREPSLALTCCGRNAARVTKPKWGPYTYGGLEVSGVDVDDYEHRPEQRRALPDETNEEATDRLPRYRITCTGCGRVYTIRHERIHNLWEQVRPTSQVRVPIADVP